MSIKLKCPQCNAKMTVGVIEDEVKCPLCRIPMRKIAPEAEQREEESQEAARPPSGQPRPSIKVATPVNDFFKKPWSVKGVGREPGSSDTPPASTRTIAKTATPVAAESTESKPSGDSSEAAFPEQEGKQKARCIIESARRQAEELAAEMLTQAEKEAQEILQSADRQADAKNREAEETARGILENSKQSATEEKQSATEEAERIKEQARHEAEEKKESQAQATQKTTDVSLDQTSDPQIKAQIKKQKTQMDGYAKREARFIMAGITFGMIILIHCLIILFMAPGLEPAIRAMTYGLIVIDISLLWWLAMLIREHYKKGNEAIKAYQQRNAARREEKMNQQEGRKDNGQKSVSTAAPSSEKQETAGSPQNRRKIKIKPQNGTADSKPYRLDKTRKKRTPILTRKKQPDNNISDPQNANKNN